MHALRNAAVLAVLTRALFDPVARLSLGPLTDGSGNSLLTGTGGSYGSALLGLGMVGAVALRRRRRA